MRSGTSLSQFPRVFLPTLTMCVFCERLSKCVCAFFSFSFEDGMWDLIVLVLDHCLCFYFVKQCICT